MITNKASSKINKLITARTWSLGGKRLKVFAVCKNLHSEILRWRPDGDRRRKGVVSAPVTVEYKEQSSGFTPEPASQQ